MCDARCCRLLWHIVCLAHEIVNQRVSQGIIPRLANHLRDSHICLAGWQDIRSCAKLVQFTESQIFWIYSTRRLNGVVNLLLSNLRGFAADQALMTLASFQTISMSGLQV